MIVCRYQPMEPYNPKEIESKWQKVWRDSKLYETDIHTSKKKMYVLDMFPYPSGEGLHVGHPKGYIATDIYSRMKKMAGFEVLHPMGWDAFGLPAEQFALKNKVHPRVAVEKNIARFKEQLSIMGFNYDWSKEINTTDPGFYKWTQWIFKQMFKKGLAYESHEPINWCPSCKTGLANEDLEGDVCERCGTKVEKKPLRQWVLKITAYADRLINDLDGLDWPEGVKQAQRNWIGKSEGSEIEFKLKVEGQKENAHTVKVFTTRADTLYGATFIAISSELAQQWMDKGWKATSEAVSFVTKTLEEEKTRAYDFKEVASKEGVNTGIVAIHPITKEEIPVWIANYILPGYGTGAIMAVPAHDERDYEFAKKYSLPITEVIRPYVIDHVNVPREDKATKVRRNVHAIVFDPTTKKYLIIRNSIHTWDTVVIGGVEEGEDLVQAATRELMEETGYTDVVYKRTLGFPVQAGYFAPHKDENRLAIATAVYFELGSHAKVSIPTDGENEGNEILWVDESEFVPGKMINSELSFWLARMKDDQMEAYTGEGILVNSGPYDDLSNSEAKKKITEDAGGKLVSQYRLKDWVFARQRYWGEPFPIVFDKNHKAYTVADSELPITLPEVEAYEPTGTGESPLAGIPEWVNVTGYINEDGEFVSCDASHPQAQSFTRETNTMPQWAGSSWYYLRFADPHNENALIDGSIEKKWMPVDVYVGGDHATRHLIYARFWHKFLCDIGVVTYDEPFRRLEFLGFILAEDGRKMSKRLGNVINPDDIVARYGADTLRLYEMFMAPFEQTVAWDTKSIVGVERFLERVWKLQAKVREDVHDSDETRSILHKTIKKVGEDIEAFKFNTAISALMIALNKAEAEAAISLSWYTDFISLLAPFAPHMTEELWSRIGEKGSIHTTKWPEYDPSCMTEANTTIAIQIGGKLRGTLVLARDMAEIAVLDEVKKTDYYKKYVGDSIPKKIVFVPNKLINIVI
jgi:leucyl-tRNA synthetase